MDRASLARRWSTGFGGSCSRTCSAGLARFHLYERCHTASRRRGGSGVPRERFPKGRHRRRGSRLSRRALGVAQSCSACCGSPFGRFASFSGDGNRSVRRRPSTKPRSVTRSLAGRICSTRSGRCLRRWQGGHRHVADGRAAIDPAQALDLGAASGRRHYLQLLLAARAAGHPRGGPLRRRLELRDRLDLEPLGDRERSAQALTAVYERRPLRRTSRGNRRASAVQAGEDAVLVAALTAPITTSGDPADQVPKR